MSVTKLRWTKRRCKVWGETHVLGAGKREILSVWWIHAKGNDPSGNHTRRRQHGWRASFEAYPADRDHHAWLGTRLTVDQAKAEAVRLFRHLCRTMERECAAARRQAKDVR